MEKITNAVFDGLFFRHLFQKNTINNLACNILYMFKTILLFIAQLPNGKTGRAFKNDEKIKERKEVKLDEKILQKYAGIYEIDPGFELNFFIENNELWVIAPEEPKLQVSAEGNHKFFLQGCRCSS